MERGSEAEGLDAMPAAVPGLDVRPAGDESLVHDPASGKVHVLNATAAQVLARCDGATTVARIAGELAAATGAEPDRVTADVVRVCADFRAKGLIR